MNFYLIPDYEDKYTIRDYKWDSGLGGLLLIKKLAAHEYLKAVKQTAARVEDIDEISPLSFYRYAFCEYEETADNSEAMTSIFDIWPLIMKKYAGTDELENMSTEEFQDILLDYNALTNRCDIPSSDECQELLTVLKDPNQEFLNTSLMKVLLKVFMGGTWDFCPVDKNSLYVGFYYRVEEIDEDYIKAILNGTIREWRSEYGPVYQDYADSLEITKADLAEFSHTPIEEVHLYTYQECDKRRENKNDPRKGE